MSKVVRVYGRTSMLLAGEKVTVSGLWLRGSDRKWHIRTDLTPSLVAFLKLNEETAHLADLASDHLFLQLHQLSESIVDEQKALDSLLVSVPFTVILRHGDVMVPCSRARADIEKPDSKAARVWPQHMPDARRGSRRRCQGNTCPKHTWALL